MRKFMVVPLAALLVLAVAAPVSAGANVSNTSGGFTGAEGDWFRYDEATEAYTYGYVFARLDKGQQVATVDFFQGSDQKVQCTGQDTPDDESDDTWGVIFSYMYGSGPATSFAVTKNYGSAMASASLEVFQESWNDCTGEGSYESLGSIDVALDLAGDGPLVRQTGGGSFHIPGDVNSHYSMRSSTRSGVGSVSVDGNEMTVDFGIIGTVSWKEHVNS